MPKILIADDRRTNREFLASLLGYCDYTVLEASNGVEALKLARAEHPDLIITDMVMPEMGGHELARRVRADPDIADTRIIFYTAVYQEREARAIAHSCGVSHVLLKPSDPEVILQTVASALGLRLAVGYENAMLYDQLRRRAAELEQEVAERKQVEETLRGSEERYRILFESNPIPTWVFDLETFSFLAVNEAAIRTYGYTREEFLSMKARDIRPPEDVPSFLQSISKNADLNFGSAGTFRHLKRDGTIIDVDINWHNLTLMGRSARLIVVTDITEHKRAEKVIRESEEKYRTLVDNIPDVTWRADAEGNSIFVSPNVEKIYGFTPEEIYQLGPSSWFDRIDPDDIERVKEAYESVFTKAEPFDVEYKIKRKDGEWIWLHDRAVEIYIKDGKMYADGLFTDITERKKAEAALAERARLAALSADIGVALTQRDCLQNILRCCGEAIVKHLGAAFARVWTLNEEENMLELQASAGMYTHIDGPHSRVPVGKFKIGFIAEERRPHLTNNVIGDPRVGDQEWARREGMVAFAGYPLIVEDRLVGVMAMFAREPLTEATLQAMGSVASEIALGIEQKQTEAELMEERALLAQRVEERTAELIQANLELARAGRMKDQFLASMSHELRTPLNAILGLSQALQEQVYGSLSDKQLRPLHTIEESGRHLLTLINDILDLSKIEAGKTELKIVSFSIDSVCEASLRMVKGDAGKKRINLISKIDEGAATMQTDARRLKQILVNLLSNAVKFTQEGGTVGLEVAIDVGQHLVRFTVSDTGIGISKEDQSRLFQPFVQLDSSLSRQYAGVGLGLALVGRLTKLLGGSVSVESVVGKGSRFTVSLPWIGERSVPPISEAEPVEDAGEKAALRRPDPATVEEGPTAGSPLILLAEDNEANILTLSEYLYSCGYRTTIARSGKEAIERARQDRPDLILMDVQMPGMDGLEATRRIRSDSDLTHIPIIALTAFAMEGDREMCLNAGANDYISKPINLKVLIEMIEAKLSKSKTGG